MSTLQIGAARTSQIAGQLLSDTNRLPCPGMTVTVMLQGRGGARALSKIRADAQGRFQAQVQTPAPMYGELQSLFVDVSAADGELVGRSESFLPGDGLMQPIVVRCIGVTGTATLETVRQQVVPLRPMPERSQPQRPVPERLGSTLPDRANALSMRPIPPQRPTQQQPQSHPAHGPTASPVNPWPIDDARHNLLLLAQELTLLEGHLGDETRSCPECITKHALSAHALAQEASRMEQGQQFGALWRATGQVVGQTLREPNLEAVRQLRQGVVRAIVGMRGQGSPTLRPKKAYGMWALPSSGAQEAARRPTQAEASPVHGGRCFERRAPADKHNASDRRSGGGHRRGAEPWDDYEPIPCPSGPPSVPPYPVPGSPDPIQFWPFGGYVPPSSGPPPEDDGDWKPPTICLGNCKGKVCGDDGCGGNCGSCNCPMICIDGECAPEIPLVDNCMQQPLIQLSFPLVHPADFVYWADSTGFFFKIYSPGSIPPGYIHLYNEDQQEASIKSVGIDMEWFLDAGTTVQQSFAPIYRDSQGNIVELDGKSFNFGISLPPLESDVFGILYKDINLLAPKCVKNWLQGNLVIGPYVKTGIVPPGGLVIGAVSAEQIPEKLVGTVSALAVAHLITSGASSYFNPWKFSCAFRPCF